MGLGLYPRVMWPAGGFASWGPGVWQPAQIALRKIIPTTGVGSDRCRQGDQGRLLQRVGKLCLVAPGDGGRGGGKVIM